MKLTKSRIALVIFSIAVFVLLVAYDRFNRGFAVDDSYITFRYALNVLNGDGVSFNVGERYYGSTATGYAILLALIAGLARLMSMPSITIPVISTALSALGLGLLFLAGYRVSTRSAQVATWTSVVAWFLFSALVFISALADSVPSHETYFYVGLLALAAMLAFCRQSQVLAALVLVVATTVRPDSILFALVLFAVQFIYAGQSDEFRVRDYKRLGIGLSVYIVGFALWICWTRFYYGTYFPGTMDAKKAQVLLGYWPLFNGQNFEESMNGLFSGSYWRVLLAGALIIHFIRVRFRRAFPFVVLPTSAVYRFGLTWLVFGVGLFCAYSVFTVTLWNWYVIPIGLSFLLAFVAGTQSLFIGRNDESVRTIKQEYGRSALLAALVIFTVMQAPDFVRQLSQRFLYSRNVNDHLTSYDAIGQYLHAQEPGGTVIATAEPGAFGYKLGRNYKIVDVLGLVSPGVAKALRIGDTGYAMRHWKPKYAIVSWEGSYAPTKQRGFFEHYELVGVFEDPHWTKNLNRGAYLFRRLPDDVQSRDPIGARQSDYPQAITYAATPATGLPSLEAIPKTLLCHFERVEGQSVTFGQTIPNSASNGLEIWGWAIGKDRRPPGDVFVTLRSDSGKAVWLRAKLRLDRPDVGLAFGQTDTRFSAGFRLNVPQGVIAPGSYVAHVMGETASGAEECESTIPLTLK